MSTISSTHQTLSDHEAKLGAIKRRKLRRKWSEDKIREFLDQELAPERHPGYRPILVPKSAGRFRTTYAPDPYGLALSYKVVPGLEATLIERAHDDDYGILGGRGRESAIRELKGSIRDPQFQNGAIRMTDIHSFYDRVPRIQEGELEFGPMQQALHGAMIKGFDPMAPWPGRGYPQGDPVSPRMALLSLGEKVTGPVRRSFEGNRLFVYSDDLLLITRSKGALHQMTKETLRRIEENGMAIVPDKTETHMIRTGTRFTYMGVEFRILDGDIEIGIPEDRIHRAVANFVQAKDWSQLVKKANGWLQSLSMVTARADQDLALQVVKTCWRKSGIQLCPSAPSKWGLNDAA